MSKSLQLFLIIFSIIWFIILYKCVRKGKISVRYSLIWFLMALILFIVGVIPGVLDILAKSIGFLTISNLVIGIILTLLMFITLVLTMIVTNQKTQIKNLIQEVSILKKDFKDGK